MQRWPAGSMVRRVLMAFVGGVGCANVAGCANGASGDSSGGAGGTLAAGGSGGAGSGGAVACDEGTACGIACVDLTSDPSNCGACGRSCVVPDGAASCTLGECGVGTCNTGFADCDGDADNGCEVASDCVAGSACPTACGSVGSLNCTDVCAPSCDLAAESCNLLDDDCDSICDNGAIAGCRVGVHRASGPNGHYYSLSDTEPGQLGYNIEALDYFHLYTMPMGELRPFFRCPKGNGKTFLTTDTACEIGIAPELTIGFISPTGECGSVPLYRTQNAAAGAHFYTISAPERDNAVQNLGFVDEGIAGYVWTTP